MKNKRNTYVLLVMVIAVWGIVGFKIFTALNPELPEIQEQASVLDTNYKIQTTIDTFSITTVDRDPFLGTYSKKKRSNSKTSKQPLKWRPIKYHGIVKNGNNQMFIITISGKQYLIKKGQVKDSITLIYGNDKYITMRYRNSSKKFKLNTK